MVSFVSGNVGGTDASFVARFSNSRYMDIGAQPTTSETTPAGTPPLVRTHVPDVKVANWWSNPFFAGKKYDEILRANQFISTGIIRDVFLDLLDNQGVVRETHRFGDPGAAWGSTGANFAVAPVGLGGTALEVMVHSWHDFGRAVLYRVTYVIEHAPGASFVLPPFTRG
jgi:hypothetical protein